MSFVIGAAVGSLAVLLAASGLDRSATALPSGPTALDIATGTHVFPYRGTIHRDGVPAEGTATIEVTLSQGGQTYTETHTDVPMYAGAFQILIGSAGTGLEEWVFTRSGVTLSLVVDGTPLHGTQTLYPTPSAVHRLENENIDFDGRMQMGERVTWNPTTIDWPHAHSDLQLALSRGASWTRPVGMGRASSNRLVYDGTRHRFYAQPDEEVLLEVGDESVSLGTTLDASGNASLGGLRLTTPGSTFAFSEVVREQGGGYSTILRDADGGHATPRTLDGDALNRFYIAGEEALMTTSPGFRVQRLRTASLRVERAQAEVNLDWETCPDGGVALGFRRDSFGTGNQLYCSASREF